ncbi:glycosyl hydrolase family 8 [Cereibacter sphaeroides]|uniref:glycosyl hydrolase family 8 n=1 Tax=Cereibacter sphaeroides TaxID=1063 RepID=UPI001F18C458|nr:glycosyl hydrolase family 8 [Cereibacter sphaeroides]MCE6969434.1 glycosyl hydrolase family 5 [Cereibacter sphaeroides]
MMRRTLLRSAAAAALCWPASRIAGQAPTEDGGGLPPDHPLQAAWSDWKAAFLLPAGRIVDGPQQNASHSEGQGYGAALAAIFGDEEALRRIADWTEANLARPDDGLLAWRWLPGVTLAVPDRNNATDGDLFYAWALALGSRRFGDADLAARSTELARAIALHCIRPHPDGSEKLVLLPGAEGFETAEGVVLNPSYYMPRAMMELGAFSGQDRLRRCARDGAAWIAGLGLAPDWALVTPEGDRPAPGLSGNSGYDAMRVPLFLLWSGLTANPALRRFAEAQRAAPAEGGAPVVFERATGKVLERSADPGFRAIPALGECALAGQPGAAIPPFDAGQPYYPATLHLMALVAQVEGFSACAPI